VAEALHILVVDDEPEVGQILCAILEEEGHSAESCRSGVEALQKLQTAQRPFDLIITDHHMPGSFTGLSFVRVARARAFLKQIVVMSGRLSAELKESYKPFHVLGFLPKPFDLKLLRAFLQATMLVPVPAATKHLGSAPRGGSVAPTEFDTLLRSSTFS
jgi:two-component system OmpR family response regulator/two-component system response regulator QseB